jgi:hypothetical protein
VVKDHEPTPAHNGWWLGPHEAVCRLAMVETACRSRALDLTAPLRIRSNDRCEWQAGSRRCIVSMRWHMAAPWSSLPSSSAG